MAQADALVSVAGRTEPEEREGAHAETGQQDEPSDEHNCQKHRTVEIVTVAHEVSLLLRDSPSSPQLSVRGMSASGRTGAPVAPTSCSGVQTNVNIVAFA